MSESPQFGFSSLSADAGRIWSDLLEMAALRRQLAVEEIRSDLAAIKRLAVVGGTGVVLALTGLPVLVVSLALQLDNSLRCGVAAWTTLAAGAALLLVGLAATWTAWRRFRRDLVGLRESLAELKEDAAWLREWVGERSKPNDV